ncbi:hypothetical protein HDE_05614 [Halotydeus destructor]|nr:hypothetical protein HDE_05614 [Halotydeus destructor]
MTAMQLNESVRHFVPWMVQNYAGTEDTLVQARTVLSELIGQMDAKEFAIQRLYLMHYLVENMKKLNDEDAVKLVTTLLPVPIKKNISNFLGQLVSLAISVESSQVLTVSAYYIEQEQVELPHDISHLPENLADVSPRLAAVLIHKGYFNELRHNVFKPHLLTCWLDSLNKVAKCNIKFNGQSLIRYALFGNGKTSAEIHHMILRAIECKKLDQLSDSFIIELANQIKEENTDEDRFLQILVVAVNQGLCGKPSKPLRDTLTRHFPNNQLFKVFLAASK